MAVVVQTYFRQSHKWMKVMIWCDEAVASGRKVRRQLLGEDLDFSPESDLEQASRRHHLCSLLQKALVDKHIKHLKMFWPFPTWQIEIGLSFSSAIVLLFQLTIYQSLPWLCRSSRYCPSFFSYCFFLSFKSALSFPLWSPLFFRLTVNKKTKNDPCVPFNLTSTFFVDALPLDSLFFTYFSILSI